MAVFNLVLQIVEYVSILDYTEIIVVNIYVFLCVYK
jgi:hypothetical protein